MAFQTGFSNADRLSGTYTSFGGTDITAVIGNTMLGTLQSISWSVTREKGPVYTMRGSADPLAFARGKRAIAGSLVFINVDGQSVLKHAEQANKNKFYGSRSDVRYDASKPDTLADLFENTQTTASDGFGAQQYQRELLDAQYSDQLWPFDVNIIASNELGKGMKKVIIGVETLNEGGGVSIDDLVMEEQYTYIARSITRWMAIKTTPGI